LTTLSNNTSWLVDNIRAYIRVGVSGYPTNDGYPGFKEFGCILVSGYLDKMTLEEAPVRQVGIPRHDARSRVMYPGSCQEPGTWIQDLAGSWIHEGTVLTPGVTAPGRSFQHLEVTVTPGLDGTCATPQHKRLWPLGAALVPLSPALVALGHKSLCP
jgi:hypothetical protein